MEVLCFAEGRMVGFKLVVPFHMRVEAVCVLVVVGGDDYCRSVLKRVGLRFHML